MLKNLLFTAAIMAFMFACGTSSPPQSMNPVAVELSLDSQQYHAALVDTASIATLESNRLHVTGAMRLPSPCYSLDAQATMSTNKVVLILTATPMDQFCATVETTLPYQATLECEVDESYTLEVQHRLAGLEDGYAFQLAVP